MNNDPPRSQIVTQNLLLLFLLERTVVGLLNWVRDSDTPFDPLLQVFLADMLADKKKFNEARFQREQAALASYGIDPFDNGFMLAHLFDFLSCDDVKVSAKGSSLGAEEPRSTGAMGGADRKSRKIPSPLRDHERDRQTLCLELGSLKMIRNKFLHGMDYKHVSVEPQAAPAATARSMATLFAVLRRLMAEHTEAIEPAGLRQGRDHTTWARLLYLSCEELCWISHGHTLPRQSDNLAAIQRFDIASNEHEGAKRKWHSISMRRVDYDPAHAHDLRELLNPAPRWISDAPSDQDWLHRNLADIEDQLSHLGHHRLRGTQIGISEWGPNEPDPDWFCIPWWRKAPPGLGYLWVTTSRIKPA